MKISSSKKHIITFLYVVSGLPFAGTNFFQLAGITFPKVGNLTFIPYGAFRNEMRGDLDILKWKPLEEQFNAGWMHAWSIIPREYSDAAKCWSVLQRKAYCRASVVLLNNIACCQFQLKRYTRARSTIILAHRNMSRVDKLGTRDASKIKNAIKDNYLYILEKTKP